MTFSLPAGFGGVPSFSSALGEALPLNSGAPQVSFAPAPPPPPPHVAHGFGPHGAVSFSTPPSYNTSLSTFLTHPIAGSSDEQNTSNVIEHLVSALGAARDPALKESLSNAMAAMHKHLAGMRKERQQALAGKLSPRLLEEAHGLAGIQGNASAAAPAGRQIDTGLNPAQYQRSVGNTAQAAADWEAHHPYAMSHGLLPHWLETYLVQAAHPAAPAVFTTAPAQNTFAAQ